MSNYEDDVLRRAQYSSPTRPYEVIAAEQAELDRKEYQARHAAADAEYRELGREIVNILRSRGIPTTPMVETWTDKAGAQPPRLIGEGWHITSTWIYQGADYPMRAQNIGIDTEGLAIIFSRGRLDVSGQTVDAIYNPRRMDTHHEGARYFTDAEDFKDGLGSVIAGNGPFHAPYPEGY